MNDNDIIKALEFCESPDCECTSFCPMFYNGTNSKSDCRGELHKNALDLINDLKTELLAVKEAWRKSGMDYIDLNAEREGKYKTAKAEAIKEFAERLKYHAYDIVLYGEIVTVSRIERTMHEMMTEGEDAERETSEVYGEWIDSHVPGSALSECSICHYDCGAWSMKFCPNCGHPMKGGANNAENDPD